MTSAIAAIDECVEQLAAAFEPPPRQTVSEWADENRRLSSEASAEPGPWRTDRAPYQRAILDALTPHSPYERVVMMAASQTGKTEVALCLVGYIIDRDPGPMLVVLPRVEDGEAWSKDRLAPMLRHTPCLNGKVADVRSRDSNNRILHKQFQGGSITIAGANSPAGLAMRPIRYVLLDEVDRYPASAGTEGDPVSLAVKRSATWWNRKVLLVSTPTVKGASRIESWWLRSNQSSYWVPCPECGTYQVLVWPNLEWPEGQPEEAQYRCAHCGVLIAPHRKPWMLARGEWRAANPKSKIAGFWISQLYSPWKEWPETVVEFLEAKHGGPETLRAFINTALGELWDDEAETSVEVATLLNRREAYGLRLPTGVSVLTAGVDLQVDRAELELVGWGRGEESWSIEYRVFPGDPSAPDLWQALDEYLKRQWLHEYGISLPVAACAIDSGFHTQAVYDFCRMRYHRRIFAIKGKGGPLPVWPKRPTRSTLGKAPLWIVGVDSAKSVILSRLKIELPGPGYAHFPTERSEEWFEQLLSETLVTSYSRGVPVREWRRKKGVRGEVLDARTYAYAALCGLVSMGLRLDAEADRIAALRPAPEGEERTAAPSALMPARKVLRSRWLEAGLRRL
jgi:phage terminase large subunit GpA-like protein